MALSLAKQAAVVIAISAVMFHFTACGENEARDRKDGGVSARAERVANQWSALGVYFDVSTGEHVIVMPADAKLPGSDELRLALGGPARVEQCGISRRGIGDMEKSIGARDFHPQASLYSYAFYFDIRRCTLIVTTDASTEVVNSLRLAFPTGVEIQQGRVEVQKHAGTQSQSTEEDRSEK